jgi:hypothetical protein
MAAKPPSKLIDGDVRPRIICRRPARCQHKVILGSDQIVEPEDARQMQTGRYRVRHRQTVSADDTSAIPVQLVADDAGHPRSRASDRRHVDPDIRLDRRRQWNAPQGCRSRVAERLIRHHPSGIRLTTLPGRRRLPADQSYTAEWPGEVSPPHPTFGQAESLTFQHMKRAHSDVERQRNTSRHASWWVAATISNRTPKNLWTMPFSTPRRDVSSRAKTTREARKVTFQVKDAWRYPRGAWKVGGRSRAGAPM